MTNQKIVNIELTRLDLCDLLIACTCVYNESKAAKWKKLHDILKQQLEKFDTDQESRLMSR